MKVILHIIWFIFGGFFTFILWSIAGILLSVTLIFSNFGNKCFKVAGFIWWPFEKDIKLLNFGQKGLIKHLIWLSLVGWELTGAHLICAFISALTIIGIPLAKKHLELAAFAFSPYREY